MTARASARPADFAARLVSALGGAAVRTDPAATAEFRADRTERPPGRVDCVVRARSVEDVVTTLRLASEAGMPVVPAVAGTNTGGLTVPERGGIVLDLRGLDRIVEVNGEDLFAVVEPGVTFGQLHAELERRKDGLRIGYPMAPPEASVAANCLLDGLGNLSLVHGSMAEWITGIEAVLADGTLVRAGTIAAGASWCARGPLPDLIGLFVGFQGTTGVVTKLGIRLWPRPRLRRRGFVFAPELGAAFAAARRIARDGTCDDLAILGWPLARMAFGIARPRRRDSAEPSAYAFVEYGADDPRDLARKGERVRDRLSAVGLPEPIDVEEFLRAEPGLGRIAELPARLDFLLDAPGGGLTWVGTYGPCSAWDQGSLVAERILSEHGLSPALVARPMREGHFGVLRYLMLFDRGVRAELERIRAASAALVDALLPLGFVPYKTPPWAVARLAPRLDPGFLDVIARVKHALDPAGILNPGKWEP
jgi:glycolate oxidase